MFWAFMHPKLISTIFTCTGPGSFVRGGPKFDNVFLVDEGREDPNTTLIWPADDGPTLNAGLVAL